MVNVCSLSGRSYNATAAETLQKRRKHGSSTEEKQAPTPNGLGNARAGGRGGGMDQPWLIEMFGWLRVVQADRVVSRFRTRKTAALLAYLAYHRHRSHPREQLIELLWPEYSPEAGQR